MARTQDSWSNIPLELSGLVLGRLHAHVDRVRFAAVCPQWRSAARQVPLPPPLPLLALKAGDIFYSMPRGEPLHFAGCKNGFICTVCGNWLVYRRFCDLLLVDPFSAATKTLPSPSRVHFPGGDEGDDSRDGHDSADKGEDSEDNHDSADEGDDSEDGSAPSRVHLPDKNKGGDSSYGHDSTGDCEDSVGGQDSADEGDDSEHGSGYTDKSEMQLMEVKYFRVIKLIECSPNIIAALFQGSEYNWIAVCCPGGSMWSVAWDLPLLITDMVFYQGKLYVVDYDEDLLALDISVDDNTGDPWVARIEQVISLNLFDDDRTWLRMLYLVESCGSLLLVRRRIFHKHVHGKAQIHTFAVQCGPVISMFKADFARSQWVKVTTLADDQALFLGPCSKAVCLPQGDSPGNRVWFLDDYKDFYIWDANNSLSSSTSSVTNLKPFSPLPMISWRGYLGNAGAAWLFPAN